MTCVSNWTSIARRAGLILLLGAVPAAAQVPPPATPPATPAPQAPVVRREQPDLTSKWYLGVLSGVQIVERAKPLAGVEFGIRVRRNVLAVVEGGRLWDVATDRRIAEVNSFATYLQQTQGQPASGHIDAPTFFGMAGLRWHYENKSGVRPYLLANAGLARVEYRPALILEGRNVTTSLSLLGVTLGRDLLGPGNYFAYGAGAGLVLGDKWYLDLGFRWTRVNTLDHHTNVHRVSMGMGRRF
jgi:opacity protein-like surface antigen